MLAQRFTAARRATCGLAATATGSFRSATPIVAKRWNSKQKKPEKGQDAKLYPNKYNWTDEAFEDHYFRNDNEYISSFDGVRIKAGSVHLMPHKHEPGACVFVSQGDPRYLDQQKGVLDADGSKRRLTVPAFWLRDNCQCSQCVNPATKQRTFNTFALGMPRLISTQWEARGFAKETKWVGGVMPDDYLPNDDKGLVLKTKWSDGHIGEYSKRFIRKLMENRKINNWGSVKTWDNEIYNNDSTNMWGEEPLKYEQVMAGKYKKGMLRLTDQVEKWGVVIVEGCPPTAKATEELLDYVGPIRNTHYGGFYDFTADLAKKDTAYTNMALAPHTDTTYFTDPAGLQAFHVLSHKAGQKSGPAKGGETILVDGFRAAILLEKADPKAYNTLCRVRIPWFSNGNRDACVKPNGRKPVIELHPETGEITCIRWNNDDRGVVPLEDSMEWYDAAKKYHALLSHPSMQLTFKLKPGSILITNNHRVLHGRTAFTGDRRVCGGYISRDDFESRWRLCKGTNEYNVALVVFQDELPATSRKNAQENRKYRGKWGQETNA